jgi:DNA (cytosine-5)-methyltransferase 1
MNYVTLFSGAGIGCNDLKHLGFKCLLSAEINKKRIEIQKLNKNCDYFINDDLDKKEIIDEIIEKLKNKKIDILIATPPCQGMSVANHKKKDELKRNSLIVNSIYLTKELKPNIFIFENVSTFLNTICTDLDGVNKKIKDAIKENLKQNYLIYSKVINFKNYGSNSSRTRTLVVGVKKNLHFTPLDIFLDFQKEKTLKEVIGDLKSLNVMGEIDENDIYHFFREYKDYMREWIKGLKEGESAFDNPDDKKPYKIVNGEKILNKNKNGDKYKRQIWNKVAPCIHTRNDILASQNTIHPSDDRVFSIRELMMIINIDEKFKWTIQDKIVNNFSFEEKKNFLKKNELTIRKAIGEAVPSNIFFEIAKKYKNRMEEIDLNNKEIEKLSFNFFEDVSNFLENNLNKFSLRTLFKIAEKYLFKKENASFYTNEKIVFDIINNLPEFKEKITILEPSVGVGNFLPYLLKKYQHLKIELDIIDIDEKSLKLCELISKRYSNIKINFINEDFLLFMPTKRYDLIIGNPPFKKVINNKKLLSFYKKNSISKSNNLFIFFLEKALQIGNFVSLIIPKSFLNSPEYSEIRKIISKKKILNIIDFGEKAFDVKIETISLLIENKNSSDNNLLIKSYITNDERVVKKSYIVKNEFDTFLIYRNEFFDKIIEKMEFNIFKVFRDRQITKKILKDKGKFRVIKSRNIKTCEIIDIENYDKYIDDISNLQVAKFLNKKVVIIPNLTYYPRATFLPKNSICDGSVAILIPKIEINCEDLKYYESDEFHKFYKIARNYGTRSLNIDKNSAKFFGILKEKNENN